MPWKVYGKCVHKLNADGGKGAKVKCHESAEAAERQKRALYASENAKALDPSAFISIPLKLDGNLVALQERIKQEIGAESIEFQAPETLHVTLIYIPNISDADLTDALQSFRMRPIEIRATQFALFENVDGDGMERALHLVVEPSVELRDLQAELYYALDDRGVAMSEYSQPSQYKPHITLGYLEPGIDFSPFSFEYRRIVIEMAVSRGEYNRILHFVYRPESRDGTMVAEKANGLRHALMVTSNAYKDKEKQIIKEKALRHYVEDSWGGNQFVGQNEFLVWHAGDPIGEIVYADMMGPFLVEVAQELPDQVVNLAKMGQEPVYAQVKEVWDALAKEDDLRASHVFLYLRGDEKDGAFEDIYKLESSALPGKRAANPWTFVEII